MDVRKLVCARRLPVVSLVAMSLFLLPPASQAQWVTTTNLMNLNFNAEPYGTYAGAPPKMDVYVGSTNDTITIADAPGMSKAVIPTATSGGGSGYGWLDQYPADGATPTVYGKHGVYSFDINQLVNSTNAYYTFSIYSYISGEGWIWGLDLIATSPTGGHFALQLPGYLEGPALAPYTTGTTYHVEFDHDYIAGTFNLRVDGNLLASQVPFDVGPDITATRASVGTNAQIKEIFMGNATAGTGT